MKQRLKPWIVGAAFTAAFLCAGPALDGEIERGIQSLGITVWP